MRPVCQEALELIKKYEACRLTAYQDCAGVLSIGWGHTGKEVHEGLVWTQDLADRVFAHDVALFGHYVSHYVPMALNDNQFGALVSFAYNCGLVALKRLASFLLAGKRETALGLWETFIHDHAGNIENGLIARRKAEVALFQKAPEKAA